MSFLDIFGIPVVLFKDLNGCVLFISSFFLAHGMVSTICLANG